MFATAALDQTIDDGCSKLTSKSREHRLPAARLKRQLWEAANLQSSFQAYYPPYFFPSWWQPEPEHTDANTVNTKGPPELLAIFVNDNVSSKSEGLDTIDDSPCSASPSSEIAAISSEMAVLTSRLCEQLYSHHDPLPDLDALQTTPADGSDISINEAMEDDKEDGSDDHSDLLISKCQIFKYIDNLEKAAHLALTVEASSKQDGPFDIEETVRGFAESYSRCLFVQERGLDEQGLVQRIRALTCSGWDPITIAEISEGAHVLADCDLTEDSHGGRVQECARGIILECRDDLHCLIAFLNKGAEQLTSVTLLLPDDRILFSIHDNYSDYSDYSFDDG